MAPSRRHDFFSQKWVGEILGSKVPSRYIQHRVNSRRGIAGLSCNRVSNIPYKMHIFFCDPALGFMQYLEHLR